MYLIGTMWTDIEINRYDQSFEIAHPQLIRPTLDSGATLINHIANNRLSIVVELTSENVTNVLHNLAYEEDIMALMEELSQYAEGWVHDNSVYGLIHWGDESHSFVQKFEVANANECSWILEEWGDIDNLCVYSIKPREVAKFTDMLPTDKQKYYVWNALFPTMIINFEKI